jgi:hypothetical protein
MAMAPDRKPRIGLADDKMEEMSLAWPNAE